jgi:hypothetical protein
MLGKHDDKYGYEGAWQEGLDKYLLSLKGKNSDELGMTAIHVALAQMQIERNAVLFGLPKGIPLTQPVSFYDASPDCCSKLVQQVHFAKENNMEFIVDGVAPWLHTLRAVAQSELRFSAVQMWKEIARGFPYISSQKEFLNILRDNDMDASMYYAQIPKGFESTDEYQKELTEGTNRLETNKSRTKKKAPAEPAGLPIGNTLSFKDGKAAFIYSCEFMDCTLREGSMLPALVLDSREEFGTKTAIAVNDKGLQTCVLRVASDDGGFIVPAQTAGAKGPTLKPGMLVGWQARAYSADIAKKSPDDPRFGWIGFIVVVLKPDLDINKGWSIHAPFAD